MASLVQFRRDTSANWSSANPILANGELGLITDGGYFKIGDGISDWNTLELSHEDFVRLDIAQTYTEPQRTTSSDSDNSISFDDSHNFSFTAEAGIITVSSQTAVQSGNIRIHNAELISGWGPEFNWGTKGIPLDLLGTEVFGYEILDDVGDKSIGIGRL